MNFKDLKKNFEIDLEVNLISPITAKQGDTARYLSFELYNNGQVLDLTGKTVKIFAKKPDNTEVFNDCTIEDNKVIVALTSQLLAVEGIAKCELMLLDENKNYITSKVFDLKIERAVNSNTAIKSTNDYGILISLMSDLEQGKKDIKVIGTIHDTMLNTIDIATDLHHNLKVSMNTASNTNKTLTNTINTANTTIANVEKADSDAQKTADGLNAAIEKVGDTDLILQGDYEVGKNGILKDISGQDIKSINKSGRYRGNRIANSPDGSEDWFFYDVVVHDVNGRWKSITAKSYFTSAVYSIFCNDSTWSKWERVYTSADYEVGTGGTLKDISRQDILTITKSGRYKGSGVINAPNPYWYFFDVEMSYYMAKPYTRITARNLSSNMQYTRNNAGGTWSDWKRVYSEDDKPTPAEIGAISSNAYEVGADGYLKDISWQDIKAINKSGRYRGSNVVNAPRNNKNWFYYDVEVHDSSNKWKKITARTYNDNTMFIMTCNNGTWSDWSKFYSEYSKPTPAEIGTASLQDFTSSKGSTGYQKLPSGLIIQWGSVDISCRPSASSSADVTLPVAFPNKCVSTFANANFNNITNTTDWLDGVYVNSSWKRENNKVSVFVHNLSEVHFPNDPTSITTNWVAIGY